MAYVARSILKIQVLFWGSVSLAQAAVFWQLFDGNDIASSGAVSSLAEEAQQVIVLNDPNRSWDFCSVREQVLDGTKVGSLRCVGFGPRPPIAEILCVYLESPQLRITSYSGSKVWSRLLIMKC